MVAPTSQGQQEAESSTSVVEITTGTTVHHITIPARPRAAKSPPLRSAVENLMKGGVSFQQPSIQAQKRQLQGVYLGDRELNRPWETMEDLVPGKSGPEARS